MHLKRKNDQQPTDTHKTFLYQTPILKTDWSPNTATGSRPRSAVNYISPLMYTC